MKILWNWIVHVDRILRGEATQLEDLKSGSINIPVGGVAVVLGLLGLVAGACTGCFSLANGGGEVGMQFLASTVKVPLLFLLTLLVTFPSLYVFNALVGSQLKLLAVLRLLAAGLAVNLSVLAAMGPIVAFFSICTTSYPFMVLLNVFSFGVSGCLGGWFVLQTLNRLCRVQKLAALAKQQAIPVVAELIEPVKATASTETPESEEPGNENPEEEVSSDEEYALEPGEEQSQFSTPPPSTPPSIGPLELPEDHAFHGQVKQVFGCWVIIFGLVGAQMAWVLRPFVGSPGMEFSWFRERSSNFFEAVMGLIGQLFGF